MAQESDSSTINGSSSSSRSSTFPEHVARDCDDDQWNPGRCGSSSSSSSVESLSIDRRARVPRSDRARRITASLPVAAAVGGAAAAGPSVCGTAAACSSSSSSSSSNSSSRGSSRSSSDGSITSSSGSGRRSSDRAVAADAPPDGHGRIGNCSLSSNCSLGSSSTTTTTTSGSSIGRGRIGGASVGTFEIVSGIFGGGDSGSG